MSELKWRRIGFAVRHGGRYLGAQTAHVGGSEVRVPFLIYRSPASAKRAAQLVGGELCEVHQGRGTGVHSPPVVVHGTAVKAPRRGR